jgi:putative two-component system response regulator
MNNEPVLHRMKILIIDDEPVNVAVLEDILKESGYSKIHTLTDSRKTISTCADLDPDMILLDLMMPYVDGFTILEGIRASNVMGGFLPVLILTADMSQETKRRALKCGATDFLLKPFDQIEVLLRIHNLLQWRKSHLLLDNQRAALEEVVRERTEQLRATITELQKAAHHIAAQTI